MAHIVELLIIAQMAFILYRFAAHEMGEQLTDEEKAKRQEDEAW